MATGRVQIVIVSDRGASGERPDTTAPLLIEALRQAGWVDLAQPIVVPDDRKVIAQTLLEGAETASVVLTSGGTGIGPRDVTPDATSDVIDREIPGFGEAMRQASRAKTPFADLSRGTAGVLGRTLVVNLPGSPKGAVECLAVVLPMLGHAVKLLGGGVNDCQAEGGGGEL